MTAEDFRRQEEHLLDWIANAQDDKERQAAHLTLNNLWQMQGRAVARGELTIPDLEPELKPRKKLTAVEKFDKKNSRRAAIMAQREKRG
jgi:hypothetical protein